MKRLSLIALLVSLAAAAPAKAQRAVRPKDAPAPVVVPLTAAAPDAGPLVPSPAAKRAVAPAEPAKPVSQTPVFKDDLTADDLKLEQGKGPEAGCSGGCEALYRKRRESTSFTLRVRPAQPKQDGLVELIVEVSEILDPPDPEVGDRRPVTGEALVAQVEGVGRLLLHPMERNAGSYGCHFTAPAKGMRNVEISRLDGRLGLKVEFAVPLGLPPGKGADLREWRPPPPESYAAVATPRTQPEDE